ncbi:hypothetical protein [Weizmannia acidilactici]|nr:hypothetical protein [Weizmannia acidilactici]
MFGHIKGSADFLRRLVAIAHNLLKQAEKNRLLQKKDPENKKTR